MISASRSEWIVPFTGLQPGQFRKLVRVVAQRGGDRIADGRPGRPWALPLADRVLLVREKRDGGWTLPGGWADALDLPSAAVEREFAEEAGLTVRAARLAAVHDGFRHNGHPPGPWHIYKLLFLVERTDEAEPVAGLDGETTDVGFFDLDDLPPLSTRRTTVEQLRLLRDRHRDPTLPAAFD